MKNLAMAKEKHLIILWPSCNSDRKLLDEQIFENFTVVRKVSGEWTERNAEINYSRFYQQNVVGNQEFVSHKGIGDFQIYIVTDTAPTYSHVETSRGYEFVNTNIFQMKEKLRSLTHGGHKIHSTNSQDELRRDVAMLWGIDVKVIEDF